MPTTIKAGWLKDSQGNKFAPKTLSSQVVKDDGTLLENNLSSQIDELKTYTDVELAKKADDVHEHDDKYYTEAEIDAYLELKSDANHNHDNDYDAKGSANTALETAKTYADNAVAQKTLVQLIVWEDND